MTSLITREGIDQAISNLNYSEKKTLQQRLVAAIRKFCRSDSSVDALQDIDTTKLIKVLWMTGDDPEAIKSRRRNLSSVKYSVNARLKRLFREGKNPEGVVIGRNNIFVMSDEAKDKYLEAFRDFMRKQGFGALSNIAKIMQLLNEVLADLDTTAHIGSTEELGKIWQIKSLMEGFSETEGMGEADLIDFGAEAFMTLSMAADSNEEAGHSEHLNHVEDIVDAIESLDEGQLKGVIDDQKAGAELQEAEAEENLTEVLFDPGETEGLEVEDTSKTSKEINLINEVTHERGPLAKNSKETERPNKTKVNKK